MSLMASFVLSFFTRDVLDAIWDLIESISEGFPTYSTVHLKSPKNQNRRAAVRRSAIKLLGEGLQLVCGRPNLALSSALVPQTLSCLVCVEDFMLINALS